MTTEYKRLHFVVPLEKTTRDTTRDTTIATPIATTIATPTAHTTTAHTRDDNIVSFNNNIISTNNNNYDVGFREIHEKIVRIEYDIESEDMFKVKFINNDNVNNLLVECYIDEYLDERIAIGPASILTKQFDIGSSSMNVLPDTKYLEFRVRREIDGGKRHKIAMMHNKWKRVISNSNDDKVQELIGLERNMAPIYDDVCAYYKMNLLRMFED